MFPHQGAVRLIRQDLPLKMDKLVQVLKPLHINIQLSVLVIVRKIYLILKHLCPFMKSHQGRIGTKNIAVSFVKK